MPRAPKKCGAPGCEQRVTGHVYCPPHHAAYQARTGWGRGSTRQSRRERAGVLARNPVCYLRWPGCTHTATEDDHIIPISRGGTDSLTNRAGACRRCHHTKSQHEAAQGHRN